MKLLSLNMMNKTQDTIYCFLNGLWYGGEYSVMAVSGDGYVLNGHVSSSIDFAKHDIASRWKWESYAKHYPFGYQLVWLDKTEMDCVGLKTAEELHNARKGQS